MAQQAEQAKNIAATANSGGGMIVYGMAEARWKGRRPLTTSFRSDRSTSGRFASSARSRAT
ncbi:MULTISPECIES: hypothetical protein [unclassified Modestobacter]|uniref:hypothetical protein n=1 Tax=unclassified Modestobacter TaxID=2643866 RepID=UPI0022AB45BA|nr:MULTISPECIES: hypothetical protein [unclassified Modestobacter]MCZ2812115.1 hypothetical protein [Modestobacter sp. VKM Ac-2979]MCZ2843839.1 hypothetical protein [Modestobacter sp. VKM Ac-2980]MCZ2849714.1 hypothetical protein [Modestobacter sp. VKM Ac-2978]